MLSLPLTLRLDESLDGLLFDTVHTQSLSHSQSVSVLCSHWVIQHSLSSFSDSDRVSGPSDSGSRSTSRGTGEDELISINTSEF